MGKTVGPRRTGWTQKDRSYQWKNCSSKTNNNCFIIIVYNRSSFTCTCIYYGSVTNKPTAGTLQGSYVWLLRLWRRLELLVQTSIKYIATVYIFCRSTLLPLNSQSEAHPLLYVQVSRREPQLSFHSNLKPYPLNPRRKANNRTDKYIKPHCADFGAKTSRVFPPIKNSYIVGIPTMSC